MVVPASGGGPSHEGDALGGGGGCAVVPAHEGSGGRSSFSRHGFAIPGRGGAYVALWGLGNSREINTCHACNEACMVSR